MLEKKTLLKLWFSVLRCFHLDFWGVCVWRIDSDLRSCILGFFFFFLSSVCSRINRVRLTKFLLYHVLIRYNLIWLDNAGWAHLFLFYNFSVLQPCSSVPLYCITSFMKFTFLIIYLILNGIQLVVTFYFLYQVKHLTISNKWYLNIM